MSDPRRVAPVVLGSLSELNRARQEIGRLFEPGAGPVFEEHMCLVVEGAIDESLAAFEAALLSDRAVEAAARAIAAEHHVYGAQGWQDWSGEARACIVAAIAAAKEGRR